MPVTFVEDTNAVAGTTTVTPASPVSAPLLGDLCYIYAVNKPPATAPGGPAGWTSLGSVQVGTGTVGAGTGPVRCTIFHRVAPSSGFTVPAVTQGGTTPTIGAGLIILRPGSPTDNVSHAQVSGTDNTSATSWSVTGGSNPGIVSGDYVIVINGFNDSASNTQTDGTQSLVATGATFGTSVELSDSQVTGGNRLQIVATGFPVTGGSASAAPVYSSTLTVARTGGALFLRVRAIPVATVSNFPTRYVDRFRHLLLR